jgi:hypothetical protein
MAECPVHDTVVQDITRIKNNQDGRPCQDHTAQLTALTKTGEAQWKEINRLKVLVYTGAGAMAFVGSLAGSVISKYLK